MSGLPLLEKIQEAETAKREAIDCVEQNASSEWMRIALATVRGLIVVKDTITTDDVWRHLAAREVSTHEPRAMGAVMLRAARLGLIRKTDRVVMSCRKECHRRPIAVWEVVR